MTSNDRPEHPSSAATSSDTSRDLATREREASAVSALVDRQFEPDELLEIVDRIAADPHLRRFYQHSRALGGLLESLQPTPREEAPAHVWRRIAERSGEPAGGGMRLAERRPRRTGSTWARFGSRLAIAAGIVAVVASSWLLLRGPDSRWDRLRESPLSVLETLDGAPEEGDSIAVEIGESDRMTEGRFVELATELLQADRRYRREMLRLISTVEETLQVEESAVGERRAPTEGFGRRDLGGELLDVLEGGTSPTRTSVRLR